MKLIKKKDAEVMYLNDYGGVCHNCNSPVEYDEKMVVYKVVERDNEVIFQALDELICPHCQQVMRWIYVYKSLDVTKELSKV